MSKLLAALLAGSVLAAYVGPALADHPCNPGEVRDEVTKECKSKK